MPASLAGMALGLIETQGYVGLIAATDAAVKAANVDVQSVERATGGLVLITLVGDVASVQVAVQTGAEAAAAVGRLVSSHVIPRPDAGVWRMLSLQGDSTKETRARAEGAPRRAPRERDADELEALPVRELRRRARSVKGIPLSGREISRVSKAELIAAIRSVASSR